MLSPGLSLVSSPTFSSMITLLSILLFGSVSAILSCSIPLHTAAASVLRVSPGLSAVMRSVDGSSPIHHCASSSNSR